MKTVNFLGRTYSVPDWANCITQSEVGIIEVWKEKPIKDNTVWTYENWLVFGKGNHEIVSCQIPMIIEELK